MNVSSKVVLGLAQFQAQTQPIKNLAQVFYHISSLATQGAQIILLQELCDTLYFCTDVDEAHFDLARQHNDSIFPRLSGVAASLGVVIAFPYFEKRAPGLYHNSLAVFDADGTRLGDYRKMHIPDDPGFYEKYYFTPGDLGFRCFDTKFLRLGTLICWDQWFPEAARATAQLGAHLLYYPTAIATLSSETELEKQRFLSAWQTTQRSHAIDNGCFVAAVNRVGREGDSIFWGHSFVADTMGATLMEMDENAGECLVEIDLTEIERTRRQWPFFRDRRIDAYDDINRRWGD